MRFDLLGPRYWPTWLGLAFMRLIEKLPYPAMMAVGRAVGRIAATLPLGFAHVARRNMELCLPELSQASASSCSIAISNVSAWRCANPR